MPVADRSGSELLDQDNVIPLHIPGQYRDGITALKQFPGKHFGPAAGKSPVSNGDPIDRKKALIHPLSGGDLDIAGCKSQRQLRQNRRSVVQFTGLEQAST